MTEYKWIINKMDCIPKKGTLIDVVLIIYWSRIAKQDNIEVSVYGTMRCENPSEADFTSYPDLTYDQICSWLDKGLNVNQLNTNLDIQIENIINPPIINLTLPWVKNEILPEIIEEKEVILEPKTI
jgi:hypothetical protein